MGATPPPRPPYRPTETEWVQLMAIPALCELAQTLHDLRVSRRQIERRVCDLAVELGVLRLRPRKVFPYPVRER
jgi:hypothetical protein